MRLLCGYIKSDRFISFKLATIYCVLFGFLGSAFGKILGKPWNLESSMKKPISNSVCDILGKVDQIFQVGDYLLMPVPNTTTDTSRPFGSSRRKIFNQDQMFYIYNCDKDKLYQRLISQKVLFGKCN